MLCEMAGRKRKLDEWDVSEMEESEGATVHSLKAGVSFLRSLRRSSLAHLLEASLPLLLCLGSQSPLSIKPHSLKAGLSFLYTLT